MSVISVDWQAHAACLGEDPELFFAPEDECLADMRAREARAKAVCASCSVAPDCLRYARVISASDGIWAGTDLSQRMCRNGMHLMTAANLQDRGDGTVTCRACKRAADKRYRQKQQEEEVAA